MNDVYRWCIEATGGDAEYCADVKEVVAHVAATRVFSYTHNNTRFLLLLPSTIYISKLIDVEGTAVLFAFKATYAARILIDEQKKGIVVELSKQPLHRPLSEPSYNFSDPPDARRAPIHWFPSAPRRLSRLGQPKAKKPTPQRRHTPPPQTHHLRDGHPPSAVCHGYDALPSARPPLCHGYDGLHLPRLRSSLNHRTPLGASTVAAVARLFTTAAPLGLPPLI